MDAKFLLSLFFVFAIGMVALIAQVVGMIGFYNTFFI